MESWNTSSSILPNSEFLALENSCHSCSHHHELVCLSWNSMQMKSQNSLLYLASFPYFHVCEIHTYASLHTTIACFDFEDGFPYAHIPHNLPVLSTFGGYLGLFSIGDIMHVSLNIPMPGPTCTRHPRSITDSKCPVKRTCVVLWVVHGYYQFYKAIVPADTLINVWESQFEL